MEPAHPLAVALSGSTDAVLRAEAEACAARWHLPLLLRGPKAPVRGLLGQAQVLMVFGEDGVSLRDRLGHVRGGAGLAALRLKEIAKGHTNDPLQRVGDLAPGERVLDATLGFAQDARVASRLVGPSGSVLGLESSLPLAVLADATLRREGSGSAEPIEVRHADSGAVLRSMPTRSVDVVLFDPMFSRALPSQPGFEMLRRLANPSPLTAQVLAEACRVARRVVLIKAARYGPALRVLGLRPEWASRSAPVVWARLATGPGGGLPARSSTEPARGRSR
ncbi:MAG TPA: class I SAM-dependent methyltransferase [Myxococcaceae bacterium]|nr:class I SAM-dependent methyltransferase [Myxococcaceae bacterium]